MKFSVYTLGGIAVAVSAFAYAVPAEFAALEQPHMEIMDLSFLGKSLGTVQVRISPDTIEFMQPSMVLSRLAVSEARRAEVLQWLSKPMARNDALSCSGAARAQEDCGRVATQQAAVIYDDAESSLKLFISPDALLFDASASQKQSRFYTPADNTHLGLVHSQNLSVVDTSGGEGMASRSFSIQGNGALGISDSSFAAIKWNANQTENDKQHAGSKNVTDLYYRYDLGTRHYVQGGLMENQDLYGPLGGSHTYSFLPVPEIIGARAGTGRAYVNQSADFTATTVPVVLLNTSRVDVYRGAQLLQSFTLQAGAHNLDVARFPDGSYPLTIKVFEGGRVVSEQTLPFAKHSGVNGSDEGALDWFVQAGRMRARDSGYAYNLGNRAMEQSDSNVYQAGVRMPVLDWPMALGAGISGDESARYAEGMITWNGDFLTGQLYGQFSLFGGSNGVRSRSTNVSWNHDAGVGLSFYHTRTDTPSCQSVSSPMYSTSGCDDSVSASASLSTGEYQWTATFTRANNVFDTTQEFNNNPLDPIHMFGLGAKPGSSGQRDSKSNSYNLSVSRNFNFSGISLMAYAGVLSTQNYNSTVSKGVFLTVNATFLPHTDLATSGRSSSTTAGFNFQGDRNRSVYNLSHSENWVNGSQRSVTVYADAASDGSRSATLDGSYDGQYGNLSGSINQNAGEYNDSRSLSINYDSSFSLSRAAGFSFGKAAANSSTPQAAVVLQVPKIGDEAFLQMQSSSLGNFDVSVDRALTVPVDGYSMADLRLNEANETTVGNVSVNGGRSFEGFLVPGHIYLNQTQANVSYTYIGRLTRDEKPLASALLFGKGSAMTEDNGGFTLQMGSRDATTLYAYQDGAGVYRCGIQQHKNNADVVFIGTAACQPANDAELPNEIKEQLQALRATPDGAASAASAAS